MCDLDGCGDYTHLPPIIVAEGKRRDFIKGLICLPLAAVLADPVLTAAAATRGEMKTITAPGGAKATGYLALPAKPEGAPAIVLIHEWWGLNGQIKAVANELAEKGYIAFAIDLYEGKVAKDSASARSYMRAVNARRATVALSAAVQYLNAFPGANGKVGTVGWCFGGGWSLNASIAAPVDATVIYYGVVTRKAADLKKLKGPVLGHFGTKDGFINKPMVEGFESQMARAGRSASLSVNWYTANHAFANPTSARYDAEDAKLAWQRTLAFFDKNLM